MHTYDIFSPEVKRDQSSKACSEIFRIAKGIPQVRKQIPAIGADVYLRTLMDLDRQTRQWIANVIAAAA